MAPQIAANYYNKSMAMNKGKQIAVLNMKGVGGKYNSLYTLQESEIVAASLVKDSEKLIEGQIEPYPFQTDDAIGPWFFNKENPEYKDAKWVIHTLVNNVSKNGNLLLSIPQRAQGNVDPEAVAVCKEIGAWLKENGEGIYGSRPFEVFKSEKGDFYFTRNQNNVYIFVLEWPEVPNLNIPELKTGGATIGSISKVDLLGSNGNINFEQNQEGLKIRLPKKAPNSIAAVFKVHQDKLWTNDDDPGVHYSGWMHKVNRNRGEFNNDVYESNKRGSRCTYTFTGIGIELVTNTALDYGQLVIIIDGQFDTVVDLSNLKGDGVQEVVYTSKKLERQSHTIEVVHANDKLIAIDALYVNK